MYRFVSASTRPNKLSKYRKICQSSLFEDCLLHFGTRWILLLIARALECHRESVQEHVWTRSYLIGLFAHGFAVAAEGSRSKDEEQERDGKPDGQHDVRVGHSCVPSGGGR